MAEIVSTEDVLGGAPRIEGRRIGVHHIARRVIDAGESPEQVAADYDLAVADVHRALVYYYDNPTEMREVQEDRRSVPEDLDVVHPEDFEAETGSETKA
ncbi:DUF433 domain-containing protein [Halorutilales archaeon Cl-col2-1]